MPARKSDRSTSTPDERISLALRLLGNTFLIQDKLVPPPPYGLYPRLRPGELLAEPGDVDIDGPRVAVKVLAPDQAQESLPVQHVALVAHERLQQLELPRPQRYRPP